MTKPLTEVIKLLVNEKISPTWCQKCGTRLFEQEIGFREQGSRYNCPDPSCPTYGMSTVVPRGLSGIALN